MVEEPVEPSEARTRRNGNWVAVSVALFTPLFSSIAFWNGHITPWGVEVIKYFLLFVAAACPLLVAVSLWKQFGRSARPSRSRY